MEEIKYFTVKTGYTFLDYSYNKLFRWPGVRVQTK
jgi:hypothetical protein